MTRFELKLAAFVLLVFLVESNRSLAIPEEDYDVQAKNPDWQPTNRCLCPNEAFLEDLLQKLPKRNSELTGNYIRLSDVMKMMNSGK